MHPKYYLLKPANLCLLASVLLATHGCKVVNYSFTGTTIDPAVYKTISVNTFYNNAGNGPANLAQTFSERMRDYYQNNSALRIVGNGTGDLHFEGAIVGYDLSPVAPTGDQGTQVQASLSRLTIRVQVKFVNTQDEEQSFDTQFSAYEDFPQSQTLTQVESGLIPVITERIILDVFNRSVANW